MISGLNASGIATAIRSAGQARATMDTMARQIATGQRVASVTDDGASWVRAQALRSTAVINRDAADWAGRANAINQAGIAGQEDIIARLDRMKQLAISASGAALGTSNRSALQVEYAALLEDLNKTRSINTVDGNPASWWETNPNAVTFSAAWVARDPTGTGEFLEDTSSSLGQPSTLIATANLATDSAATLSTLVARLDQALDSSRRVSAQGAAAMAATSRMQERARSRADRADAAAGALTDADLARASAARATAEANQQLALGTLRQAISAYGSYASGLLGNAQRTQRGILA